MSAQASDDMGYHAPGRVLRDMCVYKMADENGHQRLVINAPDQNSLQVVEVVNTTFSRSPTELSNDFKRSATLVRLMVYILTAASETKLANEMSEIGKSYDELYMELRRELLGLMTRSFDMFELFKTAFYYFDEEKVDLGKERLERMKNKSEDGKKIFDNISQKMEQVRVDLEKLIAKLANRRGKIGEGVFVVYSDCLSECLADIKKIAKFFSEQTLFLTNMQQGFDLEEQCTNMQFALNVTTYQQLTDNVIRGGFMYKLHGTILRCIAAKKVSKTYSEQLEAISAVFTDMVSAAPSRRMAQQEIADMMADYNKEFPAFAFKARVLARVQAIDWTKPAPPPQRAPPPKKTKPSSWSDWCVLM